jgi:hypothetical protein
VQFFCSIIFIGNFCRPMRLKFFYMKNTKKREKHKNYAKHHIDTSNVSVISTQRTVRQNWNSRWRDFFACSFIYDHKKISQHFLFGSILLKFRRSLGAFFNTLCAYFLDGYSDLSCAVFPLYQTHIRLLSARILLNLFFRKILKFVIRFLEPCPKLYNVSFVSIQR